MLSAPVASSLITHILPHNCAPAWTIHRSQTRLLSLGRAQPVEQELLPPEKIVVPTSGQAIDFRAELKGLLNSIMANYGQFMEMLVRYV